MEGKWHGNADSKKVGQTFAEEYGIRKIVVCLSNQEQPMKQLKEDVAAYYEWCARRDAREYGVNFHLMELDRALRNLEEATKEIR